ncbi:MAG: EAL domain-containing protein, partial [Lachnospiraceae bacterium]|nr:EAL domain-containing protein [Lachnospiraceae bacterium]
MIIQQTHGQSSYTAATFLFPIYALLYLAHANPYDLETGSVGESAFEDLIHNSYEQKQELLIMSLFLPEFDTSGKKYPEEVQKTVRMFATSFFKGASLFQLSNGHMALVADTAKNEDYISKSQKMLDAFAEYYPKYRHDYKIVFTKTWNKVSADNDYAGLIRYMHDQMPINSFRRVEDKDIKLFMEHKYILRELADISARGDLFDRRVEVYCQPVYNIRTKSYDTAEALMRLRLPDIGLVLPYQFIPTAENHKFIHTLTKIILNKTCTQIRQLTDAGFFVKRISVNVSVFDLWEPDFTELVEKIIRDSGASPEQLAIELTETQNEKDFEVIKERVNELKGSGIKFYLDDFGTGYSNFERIMELPFDIIKFDRSMVVASNTDARVKEMVSHLAEMFADMDYAVLFEGVETEEDEERCIRMSAKYLQGYRYSRPIPIERLTEFFEKRA